MTLGHEQLDVYRLSIGYVAWVYGRAETLTGVHRAARDQWLRASQSIPLNIAEGNGKTAGADRVWPTAMEGTIPIPMPIAIRMMTPSSSNQAFQPTPRTARLNASLRFDDGIAKVVAICDRLGGAREELRPRILPGWLAL